MTNQDQRASAVLEELQSLQLPLLPRYFEFIYALHTGGLPAYARAQLDQLGPKPDHGAVDTLINCLKSGEPVRSPDERERRNLPDSQAEHLIRLSGELGKIIKSEASGLQDFNRQIEIQGETLKAGMLEQAVVRDVSDRLIDEVFKRISHNEALLGELASTREQLTSMREELDYYKRLSEIDTVTKLYNRRQFDDVMQQLFRFARKDAAALAIVDIDHFKDVNDTYGHLVGDQVLESVGFSLAQTVRGKDFVARVGGEEFGVVLYDVSEQLAMEVCERLRNCMSEVSTSITAEIGVTIQLTASIGLCLAVAADTPEQLYEYADQALYTSKQSGRNKVTLYRTRPGDATASQRRLRIYDAH
jgi:diguanylate cyclase